MTVHYCLFDIDVTLSAYQRSCACVIFTYPRSMSIARLQTKQGKHGVNQRFPLSIT